MAPAMAAADATDGDSKEDSIEDWANEEIEVHEEVADLKVARAPVKPPAAQVEEHDVTHIPFRSWCDCCVERRGLGEQRGRHVGRAHEIPRVGIDYWYITSGTLKPSRCGRGAWRSTR